jgi:hypothetical protein
MSLTVGDEEYGRLALRAANRFFLKSLKLVTRSFGGSEILRGVIFIAIIDANVRHIEPGSELAQTYAGAGSAIPDELRKPISIHALAHELSLPYETTRRHVNGLIDAGLCRRRETGVIVPTAALSIRPAGRMLSENMDNLRDLYADLKIGGVDLGL